ncbi:hypothetical protein [Clostridium sp. UBA6640]|uniref:hypothetical protein n=1 Tax=Clostridium sp. UBA6640 TaxID=1946370 RepID=UPI0025B91FA6|nr:hypothetical protein [Clostridium sp. UBA6640]
MRIFREYIKRIKGYLLFMAIICTIIFMAFEIRINTEDKIEDKSKATKSVNVETSNVYLLDVNRDLILYEKNAEEKIAPASITKILTALTVLDYCKLNDVVNVGEEVEVIAKDSSRA